MPPMLAFLIAAGLFPELLLAGDNNGANEYDVVIEFLKLVGIIVSASASMFAVWIAQKNRRATQRVERKVETKRKTVRRTDAKGDDPKITIVEDRRNPPAGK